MFRHETEGASAYTNPDKQTYHAHAHTTHQGTKQSCISSTLVSSMKRWELHLQRLLVIINMGKCPVDFMDVSQHVLNNCKDAF